MAQQRKLGRATDQRLALLKNQVSQLLWNGKLETTEARAKEVQKLAEKYITLALNAYKDTLVVEKTKIVGGKETVVKVTNDGAKKLAARRQLMASLADLKETRQKKESGIAYKIRTKDVKHPLIEKMFEYYAPRFDKRAEELGNRGGYTSIHKMNPRRGDASPMALIEVL
jgi:large subunit ribosomal protein L17